MAEPQQQGRITGIHRARGPARPDDAGSGASGADVSLFAYLHCDTDGLIVRSNRTLRRWLGLADADAVHGRPLGAFVHGRLPRHWQRPPGRRRFSLSLRGADDARVAVRAEVQPAADGDGLDVWMIRDPGNELIERATRLEAAHTLTAGTIHDVNNVLTVLAGNLFLLTEGVRDKEELYQQARRARNAAERGSTLLRELLTFDRRPDTEAQTISPGNHVSALEPLLSRAVGSDYRLTIAVDEAAGAVGASPAQFESVLINLTVNARDALEPGGTVHITVREETLDARQATKLGVAAGRYVCTEVRDNGCGIPKENLDRVMRPLFSTKPRGSGSGLGLTMVRRFVERYDGAVRIDSVEGEGTRVRVWLPRSEQLAETTANMTLPLSTLPSGSERVLLYSRDGDARNAITQILETLGYSVTAPSSMEGMDAATGGNDLPPLIICEREAGKHCRAGRWIESLRSTGRPFRHIALLQATDDPENLEPAADGHLYRPVTVPGLALTVRRVLEES